jgi:methionyl aminopeptidase
MAIIKTNEEKEILYEAGARLARVLDKVILKTKKGETGRELDAYAYRLITEGGDIPAFLNYTPEGARIPFPATLCVSVNDEVVHGIPGDTPFKEGDIVSLDIGLIHRGIVVDMARTIPIGEISQKEQDLLAVTKKALDAGIAAAHEGGRVGDIGDAIESAVAPSPFHIVSELGGHGVGHKVHEEPFIANVGKRGTGPKLSRGMMLALEPIVSLESPEIILHSDGYTIKTKDGSRSAHFEDTILITEEGVEIVTRV